MKSNQCLTYLFPKISIIIHDVVNLMLSSFTSWLSLRHIIIYEWQTILGHGKNIIQFSIWKVTEMCHISLRISLVFNFSLWWLLTVEVQRLSWAGPSDSFKSSTGNHDIALYMWYIIQMLIILCIDCVLIMIVRFLLFIYSIQCCLKFMYRDLHTFQTKFSFKNLTKDRYSQVH